MTAPARTTAERAALTRERVVSAALALVDADGLDKLSMRRLAARLDVEAMSLYNHVSDKSDLLTGIADAVIAEIEIPDAASWRARITALLEELRRVSVAHPRAFPLVVERGFTTPAALAPVEELLDALGGSGLDDTARVRALWMLISYAIGAISCELADDANRATMTKPSTDALDQFPNVAAVATELFTCDHEADFRLGLARLVEAL